ncbi:MAG: YgaP-like transmembrane domain [bacterium]
MKKLFTPNIESNGRRIRGIAAIILFIGAAIGFQFSALMGFAMAGSGAFLLFEALRGWCAFRACGIKTRI